MLSSAILLCVQPDCPDAADWSYKAGGEKNANIKIITTGIHKFQYVCMFFISQVHLKSKPFLTEQDKLTVENQFAVEYSRYYRFSRAVNKDLAISDHHKSV